MTKEQAKKVQEILNGIEIDINAVDIEDIETVDELETYLQDNGFFDKEIIYYSKAMEYLSDNDNSLTQAFSLAQDMGYEIGNLNSEILASLVASDNVMSDFNDARSDIEEVLS